MMLKNVKMPTVAGGGTNSSSLKSALRRGFTIMELVIVIAVIAVLAAVLIPTFANLTQRANESADTQTVKNLNTILSSEEVLGNKAENMTEAIEIASSGGYNVTALTPTSDGNDILWNQDTNRFVLADSETGELVYADEQVDNPEISATGNYAYWKITDSDTNVEDGKYSYYLSDSFVDNDITVTTGIDVGENTDINITYQTTASQSVIFNTNGGTLTIDNNVAEIKHYGDAEVTDIRNVANNSYYAFGSIGYLKIDTGRVVVENLANINTIYVTSTSATIINNGGIVANAYAASDTIKNSHNGNISLIYDSSKTEEEIKSEALNYYNAVAKIGDLYYSNLLAAFTAAASRETVTIELISDVDLSGVTWYPIGISTGKTVVIEGNGHTISNGYIKDYLNAGTGSGVAGDGGSANYYSGFIGDNRGTLTINNLNFSNITVDMVVTGNGTGSSIIAVVLANNTGTAVLNNVTVDDCIVKGYTKVGLLHGFTQGNGSFIANKCSISNSEVILEADGSDPEACFSGIIIGYDGKRKAKINGIKLINNTISIDSTVNWGSNELKTSNDGTVYVYAYNSYYFLTSLTYVKGNGITSVEFEEGSDGYLYEK